MKSLPAHIHNPDEFLDSIVNLCHEPLRTQIRSIRGLIIDEYLHYRSILPELERIRAASFDQIQKRHLKRLYDSDRKAIKELREHFRRTLSECPFCGIDTPYTLEHYLPKDEYPAFAVYLLNLLPMCTACNNIKSETIIIDGARALINVSYDEFINRRFLVARISYAENDGIPRIDFEVDPESGITSYEITLANNHLITLNLKERFADKVTDELSEIQANTRRQRLGCYKDVLSALLEQSQDVARVRGVNHWRAILLQGLSTDSIFINKCL